MRTMILIAASILVLATACSALTGTPTPRPTYTPYPTYTPVPLPPMERTESIKPVGDAAMEKDVGVKPAGGQAIAVDQGVSCDALLQSQLRVQRSASTSDRMNQVISQIQAQRSECPEDTWDPEVVDHDDLLSNPAFCFGSQAAGASAEAGGVPGTEGDSGTVGDTQVPTSLRLGNTSSGVVRANSGRDSENNIIVYWAEDTASRPTDSAKCWLYVSRLRTWDENYYTVTVGGESSRENLPTTPTRPAPTRSHIPSTQELRGGTHTPTTSTPAHSPTAEDAIPEWAYENHPSLTEYILNLPWASGKLTAFEFNTIELLVRYAVVHSNGIEYAINENLLAEPDPFAIDIIQEFASYESAPEVADPRQIKAERRLINLPLRGQTNLLILRAQPGSRVAMDLLENAVRSAERFMGIPFPTDQVTLRFTKLNVQKGYDGSFSSGSFSGGQVRILPTHDQHPLVTTHYSPGNEKRLAEIIAHEVAHYYWHHHANWINEGMAETLTSYIENDRVDAAIAPHNPPCSIYQSIIELEIASTRRSEYSKFLCNYSMGESSFLDLHDILGDQEFIQSVRRLYKTRNNPYIESVKSAFPNSVETRSVINQHYYGDANPKNIKPSPQLPTIQITSASLHLEREQTLPPWDKTPLRSISASNYYGPLVLVVTIPRHGQGRQPYITLTVKHAESDWSEQRIINPPTSASSSHRIGPRRTPWLPGNYLASIEQEGKKLAEISWTVTP